MSRASRRDGWRTTRTGCWTRTLGERGLRVRLFQKRRGGTFYRAVWLPDSRVWDRRAIGTSERAEAEDMGRQLLGALLLDGSPTAIGAVKLGEVWERYRRTSPRFLDNKERSRRDAEGRACILLAHFGFGFDVRGLNEHDVAQYAARRRSGGIRYADPKGIERVTPPAKTRSVQSDLVLLNTILRWATTVRTKTGSRWLSEQPLAGIACPAEKNPRRPVATIERFGRSREAMQRLAERGAREEERTRWIRMELALVLAEATGRRLGSIRQLRWDDVDFERGTIRWRAEADKKGRESIIPIPATLTDELRQFRRRLSAVGGWVFAGERLPDKPMDRHLFDKWLSVAEREAGLPKLDGGLWHPYRRKWATERKHLSLKDVAAAGGWKDVETLLTCYQQPDRETLLEVMSEPRKLHDVAV